jgi:LysM repeat protein
MKQFRYAIMWMAALGFSIKAEAQAGNLVVQRDANGLFLYHTVAPKENFYSIGRLFNISPKVIAPYNGLQLTGLSIGQKIKVPLQEQNFTTVRTKVPGEVLVPVYREAAGKKVVAGFLKVIKGQSPLANGGPAVSTPVVASAGQGAAPASAAPAASAGTTAGSGAAAGGSATSASTTGSMAASTVGTSGAAAGETASMPPPPVKRAPIAKPVPVAARITTPDPPPAPVNTSPGGVARYSGEGLFHPDYLSQTDNGRKTRSASGLAGAFKSTSGWDNGKFYALMNNVDRGTVVKVTNLSNNKVVFVKVLGNIADIRQNAGMVIVLSDAAATQLEVASDKFTAELSYAGAR